MRGEDSMRRPLIAGNWKMNGTKSALGELGAIAAGSTRRCAGAVDVLVCPPATLIDRAAQLSLGSGIAIGGQDCAVAVAARYTGDVSAGCWRTWARPTSSSAIPSGAPTMARAMRRSRRKRPRRIVPA